MRNNWENTTWRLKESSASPEDAPLVSFILTPLAESLMKWRGKGCQEMFVNAPRLFRGPLSLSPTQQRQYDGYFMRERKRKANLHKSKDWVSQLKVRGKKIIKKDICQKFYHYNKICKTWTPIHFIQTRIWRYLEASQEKDSIIIWRVPSAHTVTHIHTR